MSVYIMAMDVAFAHIGVAVLRYDRTGWTCVLSRCITTEKSDKKKDVRASNDDASRCAYAFDALNDIAELKQFSPMVGVVAELPTAGSKSSRAARSMGMGTAVAACFVASLALPCDWTTPDDGKKALAGARNASKQDMKLCASKLFPESVTGFHIKRGSKTGEYDDNYEHVADALGAFMAARGGAVEKFAVTTFNATTKTP